MPTLEQLQAAVVTMPQDPVIHFSLANAYRDLGRVDEALEHYRLATRWLPDYSAAWFELARLAEKTGRLELAREAYEGTVAASHNQGDDHLLKAARLRLSRIPDGPG